MAAPPEDPAPPDAPPSPSLDERIEAAVQRIGADTCFAKDDPSDCEWTDVDVTPAALDMAVSTGEAILVIDDVGAGFYPQLVRYRNRILGIYRVNGDTIEAERISAHVPKALGETLVSFAGPEFIPASSLARLGSAAADAYGKLDLLFYGHGGVVFSHLAELAPEQPLVLLELDGFLGLLPSLCAGVDDASLAAARAHFAAIAASLRQLMAQHDVRFVNASFGDTVETMATDWSRKCAGPVPDADVLRALVHVYDPIYDALFHTDGVIAAHAAANLGAPIDFPFDQRSPQYPNRVRVGFISSLASGLDELGRGAVDEADQFPRAGDADVYLNWGCETFVGCADPHYEMAGPFGLGSTAVTLMSSSYVNPLAVGRLINLRYANHAGEPMTNELIQTLERELTPSACGAGGAEPCVYQDPILHHQLEIYRKKYR